MRRPSRSSNALTAAMVLAGVVVLGGAIFAARGTAIAPAPTPDLSSPAGQPGQRASDAHVLAEIDELHARLEESEEARLALERSVARLERDLATLESLVAEVPEEPEAEASEPAPTPVVANQRAVEETFFEDSALIDAGYPRDQVARLRARFEQAELDELYLRDAATREGWMRSQRYRDEREALRRSVQDELGEEDYRSMLYAAGRQNALVIRHVLQDSAAETAGIQPGDVILRYGDDAVFTLWGLRSLTSRGRAGEQVLVEVSRDGRRTTFALPRGPLGARLNTKRVLPGELD